MTSPIAAALSFRDSVTASQLCDGPILVARDGLKHIDRLIGYARGLEYVLGIASDVLVAATIEEADAGVKVPTIDPLAVACGVVLPAPSGAVADRNAERTDEPDPSTLFRLPERTPCNCDDCEAERLGQSLQTAGR